MSLHGLRHSNATFLLSTGMPDKDVAKRLGHTTEVLARVYTHSNKEDDKKLIAEIEKNFYNKDKKNINQFSTASIMSIVAGYVDNKYKMENYRLLDFLSNDRITTDNIDNYLKPCQNYLIEQFPVLDIFQNSSVIPNEDIFNEKVEAFINLMGQNSNVTRPNYNLLDLTKNKNI